MDEDQPLLQRMVVHFIVLSRINFLLRVTFQKQTFYVKTMNCDGTMPFLASFNLCWLLSSNAFIWSPCTPNKIMSMRDTQRHASTKLCKLLFTRSSIQKFIQKMNKPLLVFYFYHLVCVCLVEKKKETRLKYYLLSSIFHIFINKLNYENFLSFF